MDHYLQEQASFQRLHDEYLKYGSLIVAVDFDDTLYDFHQKGREYEQVYQLIRDLYDNNCHIIIWTGNEDTEFISEFLYQNSVPFHSINENHEIYKDKNPRKIYANVYIDDRAGLKQVYQELLLLISFIKSNK